MSDTHKVLVLDDSEDIKGYFKKQFPKKKVEVLNVSAPEDVLQKATSEKPVLIFIDGTWRSPG